VSVVRTVNPATGEELAQYPTHGDAGIESVLDAAVRAQVVWAARSIEERSAVLRRAAQLLRDDVEPLSLLVTREMGKPLAEAAAEVEKCATACDYYADNAGRILADEVVETSADRSWISYEPVGVVLAVMPWNFPLWQVVRFAAPALMTGNAALLKHSPDTTGSALAVQDVLMRAGVPDGLFTALVVAEPDVPVVTSRLIADPRIGAVTVTGSERAGTAVGAAAGTAVKKSVLELGGSDPFVILADADVHRVVAMAVKARYLNGGQSCISAKRFIVDSSIVEDFTARLVSAVEALTVGDPEAPGTEVGPMARTDLVEGPHRQVQESVAAGARLATGGHPVPGPGNFYAPTVLTDVAPGMPAYDEETFGPAAAVIAVDGDEDAARVANDTRFGLGASVWTSDPQRGLAVAARSAPVPPSSTPSSPPTCGCPSVAPVPPGTGGSWPRPACGSSSTYAPTGCWTSRPARPRPRNERRHDR
jgi:succinate-semialdehyde dehydrogenase/glutarate-semialdehyde dehydrogenase